MLAPTQPIVIPLNSGSNTIEITSKGQVTISQEVRDGLGPLPHTAVGFELAADHARIRKTIPATGAGARGRRALEALRGSADTRMSANDIMALTRVEGRRGR